jgi:hypothetical protein
MSKEFMRSLQRGPFVGWVFLGAPVVTGCITNCDKRLCIKNLRWVCGCRRSGGCQEVFDFFSSKKTSMVPCGASQEMMDLMRI